ncbi:GNAT family N-acetyltransferase [Dysosmobacter sp.]
MLEKTVLEWVARDTVGYGYLLDFYRRGARLCWADEAGLALKDDAHDIVYTGGTVPPHVPELGDSMLLLTDSRPLAQELTARGHYRDIMTCAQALYLKKEPVVLTPRPGVSVRPLTMEDLDFVVRNYHNPGAYASHIRGRIAEGMLGGLADGELAGFAGVHQEGAMGLLEVLPAFRRRGLAEVLEAAVINRQLRRGRLPYCHVRVGNTASETLQKKLGLTFDSRLLYWLD